MRNGVGEATGGTWPTYSRGGGVGGGRGGGLRSGREKEKAMKEVEGGDEEAWRKKKKEVR